MDLADEDPTRLLTSSCCGFREEDGGFIGVLVVALCLWEPGGTIWLLILNGCARRIGAARSISTILIIGWSSRPTWSIACRHATNSCWLTARLRSSYRGPPAE
jgi:hypothetical protein